MRDVGNGDAVDAVARALAEIRLIGLLAEFVVVGGENAPAARALEGDAEAAELAEEVNEPQVACALHISLEHFIFSDFRPGRVLGLLSI